MGMSEASLSSKLSGKAGFSQEDIFKACQILDIPDNQNTAIASLGDSLSASTEPDSIIPFLVEPHVSSGNLAAYHAPVNGIFALAASGVIGDLIAVPAFLTAMSLTTVNKANVIKSAYPILLSVLAWLIFKEYMNIWMFIGIVITVIGVVIVNRVPEGEEKTAYAK